MNTSQISKQDTPKAYAAEAWTLRADSVSLCRYLFSKKKGDAVASPFKDPLDKYYPIVPCGYTTISTIKEIRNTAAKIIVMRLRFFSMMLEPLWLL